MGGKNHQPCRVYLEKSTRLSRSLSLAHAQLELANVDLEDLLLRELNNQIGNVEPIKNHLRESEKSLEESLIDLDALKKQMEMNHYADLPPLHTLDLLSIGDKLAERKIVEAQSWKKILEIMRRGTFYAVIQHFKGRIVELHSLTCKLSGEFLTLAKHAESGEVTSAIEQNCDENIKATFGQLYTAWSIFNQEFLASSLISTETWYKHSDYGSLLDTKTVGKEYPVYSA